MDVRVVFDTVIFVRGLMSPFGRWGRLVFDRTDDYRLVVSAPVLSEYVDVLRRPELVRKYRGLATRDVPAVFSLLEDAEMVIVGDIPAVSRDPKDDPFLATAKAGEASFVVSEDNDLLVLAEYEGIRIVDAATFLHALDEGEAADGRAGA